MRSERFHRIRRALERRQPDLTVLMERVHKPHNFSAILRNCDAVGVLEAHAVPPDEGLPVYRGTSGSASRWMEVRRHDSVAEAATGLKREGFRLVAAHPTPGAKGWTEVDYTRPTAFLVGTELHGLTDEALELADEVVVLPMAGMVRSLNVSVATAILLYEAYRQRDDRGFYDRRRLPDETFERLLFEWSYPRIAEALEAEGRRYPELGEDGEILEG
ncbi:MAG: tRNA (guanosine(18)-2'-O)-methyltransferase TrmH [Gemmatimonadota bacterium]